MALVAGGGPDGGLFACSDGRATRLASSPDLTFVLPLAGGRILALAGSADGEVRVFDSSDHRLVAAIASGGADPCHAAVLDDGSVLVVNYTDASLLHVDAHDAVTVRGVWRIEANGSGIVADRQDRSHPHFALPLPDGSCLVADLGCDLIRRVSVSADGIRETGWCATPAGSGPRHLVLVGDAVVCTAELSGEVIAAPLSDVIAGTADWASVRSTALDRRSARDGAADPYYPSDVVRTATDVVAVANRSADTVARFLIAGAGEALRIEPLDERPAGGAWPQCLLDTPEGLLVAVRDSDAVLLEGGWRVEVPAPMWIAPMRTAGHP